MPTYPPLVDYPPLDIESLEIADHMLIEAYVPEAGFLTHEEALEIAKERDFRAAQELADACIKAARENREKQILYELGYY